MGFTNPFEMRYYLHVIFMMFLASTAQVFAADLPDESPGLFSLHFWSIDRYALSTTDFEEVDDARNFTSEALFSESVHRLYKTLSDDEYRNIIRTKRSLETYNNLRISLGRAANKWIDVDIFFKYRNIGKAQITRFDIPNKFNDVSLHEYGMAAQRWFFYEHIFIRSSYNRVSRKGIIEYLPNNAEDIDAYELNAVFQIGDKKSANRAFIYPTYVFQDIRPEVLRPPRRERRIASLGFAYGNLRFQQAESRVDPRPISSQDRILERRFDPRGLRLYCWYVRDDETYGKIKVTKQDFFIGSSFPVGPLNLAIQPSLFTSTVGGDPSQDNSQYRTEITWFYQPTQKLHVIVPMKHDMAASGPKVYENVKVGIELRYIKNPWDVSTVEHRTTEWSLSLRYDKQSFYRLDKDLSLISVYARFGI